jgi:nitroreductase
MDLNEAIAGRRAVREFTAEQLDERTIRRLIDAAVHAPSAVNEQPWTFTVVRNQGVLSRVSQAAKQHMITKLDLTEHGEHFRAHLEDPKFHIFYHAPAMILISAAANGPWIVEDCALAAENLMLAAHADGLGSCWVGFAQSFVNTPEGKTMLGLPEAWVPIAPIIVGRPKGAPPATPRNEPEIRWID